MNTTNAYDMVALQMNEMRRESKRWKLAAEAGGQKRSRSWALSAAVASFLMIAIAWLS